MDTTCRDCGAVDGELHEMFCLKERCPFCSGQLAACDCIFTVLKLTDEERELVELYKDDSVDPLRSICARWRAALEEEGRIPFKAPS